MSESLSVVARLRGTVNVLYREMIKFGIVGSVAFVAIGVIFVIFIVARLSEF